MVLEVLRREGGGALRAFWLRRTPFRPAALLLLLPPQIRGCHGRLGVTQGAHGVLLSPLGLKCLLCSMEDLLLLEVLLHEVRAEEGVGRRRHHQCGVGGEEGRYEGGEGHRPNARHCRTCTATLFSSEGGHTAQRI